jgi:Ca2+-binding EF-hand superfamily protein
MDQEHEVRSMFETHTVSAAQRHLQAGKFAFSSVAIAFMLASGALAEPSAGDAELFDRLDANENGVIAAAEVSSNNQRLFAHLLQRGDSNGDAVLSRDEFVAALVPSRPDKPIEPKQPATFPQANAVRWLLLTLDTSGNGWIEAREVPNDLKRVFDNLANRLDTNKNDVLETMELTRGGRPLAQIAGRYVQQNSIDVDSELKDLVKQQGAATNRFEERRGPFERLADPQQAGQLFAQLDANRDGQIELREAPEPFRRPVERLLRSADRDGNGRLSQSEFLLGARRISARMARQSAAQIPPSDATPAESMQSQDR